LIGRASGSCRLTTRVAESTFSPATRRLVWATTAIARVMRVSSSLIRLAQQAARSAGDPPQRLAGVGQHRRGVVHGGLGEVGQLSGQAQHGGLSLLLGFGAA
jgi:hypothetical protein